MEEEKYYVPSIKEFHVGFEYEYFHPTQEWIKHITTLYDLTNFNVAIPKEFKIGIKMLLDNNFIRVKYLDKEGIESLGWKYNMPSLGYHLFNYIVNKKGDIPYRLYINYETHEVVIRHPLSDGHEKFSGIIKNKSELEFIMKSLQIIK